MNIPTKPADIVFDLLEAIADGLQCSQPDRADNFRACFARGTGGVDWENLRLLLSGREGGRHLAKDALPRGETHKDEACSRPSDALDAPVADQSTTCSQPERNY